MENILIILFQGFVDWLAESPWHMVGAIFGFVFFVIIIAMGAVASEDSY